MFCDKCGNQLRDGAKFCPKCGVSVSELDKYQNNASQSQAQSVQQDNQTQKQQIVSQPAYQPQPRSYYAPRTHPYHRLGGFLMFLVVINYISGVYSFINVISTIISYSGLLKSMGNWVPGGLKTWFILNMIIYSVLQFSAGLISISFANRIRRKESDFLHFIQSSSLTLIIIVTIWCMISFIWIKQYDQYGVVSWGSLIGILIAMVIALIIGVIISSVYYGCSVRVRTYMGSDSYLKKSIFNKNSYPIPADGSDQPSVTQSNQAKSYNPQKQWFCMTCGRINEKTTGTCACGNTIPSRDLSKSWTCNNCGRYNNDDSDVCYLCGHKRYPDLILTDWICPECGGRNIQSAKECKVCYTPKPGTGTNKRQKNW